MDYKPVDLPQDVMYEILLHLPAKTLCRLRAVCRPWRSLISSAMFIAAHAARHPRPHLIACYDDTAEHKIGFGIMDLSGQMIKQVHRKEADKITDMSSDLVCIRTLLHNYRLVNPATGVVFRLPRHLAQEHVDQGFKLRDYTRSQHMFGFEAKKGEYKVLRKLERPYHATDTPLFEVYTLNSKRPARWRAKQAPPLSALLGDWTVIDGVVYVLNDYLCFNMILFDQQVTTEQYWIVSFDLETEEWRPNIRGPNSLIVDDEAADRFDGHNYGDGPKRISLTKLDASLVIFVGMTTCMDMWFLMDGFWVKKCSVLFDLHIHPLNLHPLR
ncbi:hypothetical protein U9M48_019909 [Paspalum notatum var. saurae]|uniref:F-box domain-containing protein n=1 Tax=Paspalum notatum var. saurae TaxID=547442 RepID=A0AAQ3TGQ1_PASNO